MSFLERQKQQSTTVSTPFSKKKSGETRVVKLDADLHSIIKIAAAKGVGHKSIFDHLNQAVEEYIVKHDIENKIK